MISSLRRLRFGTTAWRNEGAYFVTFNLSNALNYGYLLVAGFFLSTESFGLFGALFGLVYLTSSVGNMVRVAVARQVASLLGQESASASHVVHASLRWPALLAAGIGLAFAAAVPLIQSGFDSSLAPAVWTVIVVVLSIWAPAGYGVLQGEQRFAALGGVLMVAAAGRLVAGVALIALGYGVAGAMAGMAIGYWVSAALTLLLILPTAGRTTGKPRLSAGSTPSVGSLAVVLLASAATAAATSVDVALVRYFFSPAESGVFATIAVLGRVVLFATVAIPFVALPKVAQRVSRGEDPLPVLRWSLLFTAVIAVPVALGIALAVSLGWSIVGTDLSGVRTALYWYLAGMVSFALLIAFVYHHLGTSDSRYLLGVAVPTTVLQALLIAIVPVTLTEVAQIECLVNCAALLLSVAVVFGRIRPFASRFTTRRTISDGAR